MASGEGTLVCVVDVPVVIPKVALHDVVMTGSFLTDVATGASVLEAVVELSFPIPGRLCTMLANEVVEELCTIGDEPERADETSANDDCELIGIF